MHDLLKLINVIMEKPAIIQLGFFIIFMLVFSSLLGFIFFPLIFNYFIIPRIELRLGKKLEEWGSAIEMLNFSGKFAAKCAVVASCIFFQCLILKFSKDPGLGIEKFNQKRSRFTDLAKANYDVRDAPRYEVVFGFLAMTNLLLWVILAAIFWFFIRGT